MRVLFNLFLCVGFYNIALAQYNFNGYVDKQWQGEVYLSIIEDYRTLDYIDNEQIVSMTSIDSSGYFAFSGNQLDNEHKIYRLHVDNCDITQGDTNNFIQHCSETKNIVFIAKNSDTIHFPLSFNSEMFCDVISSNPKTTTFIKIDSLKEEMEFAYSEFRSKASRELNNKKWFKILQTFGEQLQEPLAELYMYNFISERGGPFHTYYLEDLKTNSYYTGLLNRLEQAYPNSSYTKQYKAEIQSDKYITQPKTASTTLNWTYVFATLLTLSLLLNCWLLLMYNKRKSKHKTRVKEQLTKQEQNVLDLILKNHSNKEIADALFVSVSTVKTHVNNLYKKLNVSSRSEIKTLFIS